MSITKPTISIATVAERWRSTARPAFTPDGMLIDKSGAVSPQGDVLRLAGRTDDELRAMDLATTDREVARLLGISLSHTILLRHADSPADALEHPAKVLGALAANTIEFWWLLDRLDQEAWYKVISAWTVKRADDWHAARKALDAAQQAAARTGKPAGACACEPATILAERAVERAVSVGMAADVDAATIAAAQAAQGASNEIQGAHHLRDIGWLFVFAPLFGIADAIPAKLALDT